MGRMIDDEAGHKGTVILLTVVSCAMWVREDTSHSPEIYPCALSLGLLGGDQHDTGMSFRWHGVARNGVAWHGMAW